jgi:hypothetical protein
MEMLAALFVEGLDQRQVEGPATRIDLTGVMFSLAAPSELPVSLSPHLVVLVRCPEGETGSGTLEVEFLDGSGKQVARSVQPVSVMPGKFGRFLVKGDLTYEDYGTIEAHCRLIGDSPADADERTVPLTLLPPA